MQKTLTAIVLVLAAVAAAVGGFMWWKSSRKTEAATQEVKNQTGSTKPADGGGLDASDFDPTSGSAKYGQQARQVIDWLLTT